VEHRGRIQAQSGGLEESESWSSSTLSTQQDGLDLIDKLERKIPLAEAMVRKKAFEQARIYVKQATANGGVDAQVSRSFPKGKGTKVKGIRVDIEVITGKAFVP